MNLLLPCKYPTTTLILDDNLSFLQSLEMILPQEERSFIFTTEINHTLDIISSTSKNIKINYFKHNESGSAELDYSVISNTINNIQRKKEISVLIVDYHMPKINGIDFCQQIKNLPCKKILLTANADKNIAVDAFNKGVIYQYIQKQDINLDKLIIKAIKNAENQYMIDKFQLVMSYSLLNNETLLDSMFVRAFIRKHIKDENIKEYYLIDKNGSFLFIDRKGLISKILIKNKEEIRIPLTWREAENIPKNLFDDIWNCKKMLTFSIEDIEIPSPENWSKYLVPTIKIDQKSDYFLAVIKNIQTIDNNNHLQN